MQVQVHAIDTEITRPYASNDGIEIGTVAIEKSARIMNRLRLFEYFLLEEAAGVWIGEHKSSHFVVQRRF